MSGILLTGLAAVGAFALVFRLVGTIAKWLLLSAEITLAEGRIESAARRGDLTALAEFRAAAVDVRKTRRASGVGAFILAFALILPLAAGVPGAYAIAAILWLLPGRATSRER